MHAALSSGQARTRPTREESHDHQPTSIAGTERASAVSPASASTISRTALPPGQAEALAAELRDTISGEVRFDAGSRALYATDGSNYRQVPIGVVVPRDTDDVVQTVAAAHRFGAPILSRGCGTSLAGQCCNVAVVMDFSKYMHGVAAHRRRQEAGHRPAGLRARRPAARGREARTDLRARSRRRTPIAPWAACSATIPAASHSLLAAKHGRGLRTADNTHELEILTYDGLRLRVGETPPERTRSDHPGRRPARRAVRQAQGLPRQVRRRDPPALSAVAAARVGLQPRRLAAGERLPRRRPWSARKHAGHHPRSHAQSRSQPGCAVAARARLSRRLQGLRPPDGDPRLQADRPGGPRPPAVQVRQGQGRRERRPGAAAAGQGLPDRRVRRRQQGRRRRPGAALHGDAEEARQCAEHETARRPARREDDLEGARGRPRLDRLGARPCRHLARLGRLGGAARQGRPSTCRDLRKLFDKYGYHPSLYGHFGQGCIHCRVGFDLYTAPGIEKFKAFMDEAADWWCATAARCPASTATARHAASSCRRCSATRSTRPSASSRRSGTRTGR